jgi:hypothetical protein
VKEATLNSIIKDVTHSERGKIIVTINRPGTWHGLGERQNDYKTALENFGLTKLCMLIF